MMDDVDCKCNEEHRSAVDFSTFVLSLGTSVLYHLGVASDPETGTARTNLPMARQVIDIMSVLKDKTTGNLTIEEGKLLDTLLFDLRLKFVEASRHAGDPASPAPEPKPEE